MKELWTRYKDWLETHAQPLMEEWEDGVSEWDIQEAQEELDMVFPQELKESFLAVNGGKAANGLIGNWDLLTLDEMVEEALDMDERVEDGDFGSNLRQEDPQVKGNWWNPNWLPIVSSGRGDYICVDMDPGPEGVKGQVIVYFYASGERPVLAQNVKEWLTDIVTRAESGEFSVSYNESLDIWVFNQSGLLNLPESE